MTNCVSPATEVDARECCPKRTADAARLADEPVTVTLFWNHICILHNFEKAYLTRLQQQLATEGINLVVRFFGLGYATHMASYLACEDAELPDLIVSADLEVFECDHVFRRLGTLFDCAQWLPLRDTPAVNTVRRGPQLLPVVAIPIVLYGNGPISEGSLPDLARAHRFSFGGIDNSAAKTVVKAVWERYGERAAGEVLANSVIAPMPIGAFQNVRAGQADVAAVPSLYALRADGATSHRGTSTEGPLLLPSYFCARTSLDEALARRVCEAILSTELMDFYSENGDLVVCLDRNQKSRSSYENESAYFAVSQSFINSLDDRAFYSLYRRHLPEAETLFSS